MRIVRNLIKYTLGLPVLLIMTLVCALGYIIMIVMNEDDLVDTTLETIKDMWQPK